MVAGCISNSKQDFLLEGHNLTSLSSPKLSIEVEQSWIYVGHHSSLKESKNSERHEQYFYTKQPGVSPFLNISFYKLSKKLPNTGHKHNSDLGGIPFYHESYTINMPEKVAFNGLVIEGCYAVESYEHASWDAGKIIGVSYNHPINCKNVKNGAVKGKYQPIAKSLFTVSSKTN